MKLIIQIPCKNEADTLPMVIGDFPKDIAGIDVIEYQVIDDWSTDNTVAVAQSLGVHHIVRLTQNKGLWVAFKEGVQNALSLGADILVNTDWDNQYPGRYIQDLVKPILFWDADIVIGNRDPSHVKHFSLFKRFLQWLWNKVVSAAAGTPIKDSVSGFRAYSKNALIELNVTSQFSYVIDTIVQAIKKWLKIEWISIVTNKPTRESRLFPNIFYHIKKTLADLIRVYIMYQPFKLFLKSSIPFLLIWIFWLIRFSYYYLIGQGSGKIQSLVVGGVFIQVWLTLVVIWIISDLIAKNRFLIEENLKIMKKMKYDT